ncbi:Glyoxylase, beta-lactamase superfamily II [Hathewaya proteolytica DSM 3090]|uniref:Glyoxylase, beta-lactamase superfamily II n=1 Tax=Hathewaya proteolytica DSM 3090 TaxID=1121331 RepID=A0A1M6LH04_9CLOT|nr:MBL fold metallo-hydrolase [Hathewaya proteolytica]SHJ70395.1 Glyoxylase, beta-lactamase superfamily II [Hathewaya proteolytica DSM 3090]
MEFAKIHGNTYYINSPTNVGVYAFKGKQSIVVDTGINNTFARKADNILKENGLKPKYIFNTHHHSDHTGGNKYFRETYTGIQTYASVQCKTLIQQGFLDGAMLFGGNPIKILSSKENTTTIDNTVEEGMIKIEDEKFSIHNLPGHAVGSIGISTPDKVCFVGDAIFSMEILKKYSFPFLYDIEETLNTLEYMKTIEDDFFLPSHCNKVLDRQEFLSLIEFNNNNIRRYKEQILDILSTPVTKEDILQNLCIFNELELSPKQYYLNMFTVSAFLCYFENNNILKYSVEDGKMYFYTE